MTPTKLGVVVGFAFAAALVTGFVAGGLYETRRRFQRPVFTNLTRAPRTGLPDSVLRMRDTAAWIRDSLRREAWKKEPRGIPREIARVQAIKHCAVSFEMREAPYRKSWLFHASARSVRDPFPVLSEGWTLLTRDLRPVDTATVVIPNMFCGDITISGIGGSLTQPLQPPRLEVR
jgi:hypothetical protein